jgi:septum formation protein
MLILASASPRRHELLTAACIEHVVRPATIDETRLPAEPPKQYAVRIAQEKAAAVSHASEGDIVLGADTVVCVEGEILGKPASRVGAADMLRKLSGREHSVLTGIALCRDTTVIADLCETLVWFDRISEDEIAAYVATGDPMDKAGAYGIQGYASRFVRRIEGCYHNVVGLPVSLVYRHLKSLCA